MTFLFSQVVVGNLHFTVGMLEYFSLPSNDVPSKDIPISVWFGVGGGVLLLVIFLIIVLCWSQRSRRRQKRKFQSLKLQMVSLQSNVAHESLEGSVKRSRENNGKDREAPSLALGICEFHQSYF